MEEELPGAGDVEIGLFLGQRELESEDGWISARVMFGRTVRQQVHRYPQADPTGDFKAGCNRCLFDVLAPG